MRQIDIDNWFRYHAPNEITVRHYAAVRAKARELAELFDSTIPDCADKTAAMRDLRGTVMAMNLAIACYQEPEKPGTIRQLNTPASEMWREGL